MYIIKDNTIIPVAAKDVIHCGTVTDTRITKIETIVANHYQVPLHSLTDFKYDTTAKIMCCFLLHDMLQYSIGSIAHRYNINRLFLKQRILNIYVNCLQDVTAFNQVLQLRDAFTEPIEQPIIN